MGCNGPTKGRPSQVFCTDESAISQEPGRVTIAPLRCKRWTCPHCAPSRQKRLKAEARAGEPNTFITLTVSQASGENPTERARALVAAWRKLRALACAKYGYERIPFLATFEATKRGEPHLHILCRVKWLDQAWLSDTMRDLIGAPIVDIRRVRGVRQAAQYIAKYIAKAPERFEGCKRYWRSLDYFVEHPERTGFTFRDARFWVRVEVPYVDLIAAHQALGYRFDWRKDWAEGERGPPGHDPPRLPPPGA